MKYSEKLKQRYLDEISSWKWDKVKEEALDNKFKDFDGETRAECFLGTVFGLMPSGKYYMPWCTNQTSRDVIRDSLYMEALEEIAEEHGMYITSGEGDPCDLFAGMCVEDTEEKCSSCGIPIGPMPEDATEDEMLCDACLSEIENE